MLGAGFGMRLILEIPIAGYQTGRVYPNGQMRVNLFPVPSSARQKYVGEGALEFLAATRRKEIAPLVRAENRRISYSEYEVDVDFGCVRLSSISIFHLIFVTCHRVLKYSVEWQMESAL